MKFFLIIIGMLICALAFSGVDAEEFKSFIFTCILTGAGALVVFGAFKGIIGAWKEMD